MYSLLFVDAHEVKSLRLLERKPLDARVNTRRLNPSQNSARQDVALPLAAWPVTTDCELI